MKLIDRALFLKKSKPFETLDLDLLLPIADKMEELSFAPKEKVFSARQPATSLYLIVEGSIAIAPQGVRLEAGDLFGDESLFNNQPRGYTASALEPTRLLRLSRTNLITVISECPTVALSLLEAYAAPLAFRERGEDLR